MAAGDLTTLANVEAWLNLTPGSDPNVDALLTRLISACSTYMQTLMSRTIGIANYSEVRNGLGGSRLVLLNQPIVSVSSLAVDGVSIAARAPLAQSTVSNPGGYTFDDTSIMLSYGYSFCRGYQNVQVAYQAGFATVPFDLEQACIDTVGDWFKYRDRIGKVSEAIMQQSINFTNADLPARAKGVLLAYKRVSPIF